VSRTLTKAGVIAAAAALVLLVVGFVWLLPPGGRKHSGSPPAPDSANARLAEAFASIVANYQKIIVLLEDEKSLDARQLADANFLGRFLFYENQKAPGELADQLISDIQGTAKDTSAPVPARVRFFMDCLERQPDWRDADKLVFFELVGQLTDEVQALPENHTVRADIIRRIEDDGKALLEIQTLYNKELEKVFGRFETRGMVVRRERWEEYVAYLKTRFTREKILEEYKNIIPAQIDVESAEKQRGAQGAGLPPKGLVLTFDDGPHLRHTSRIMEILKKNKANAVFFEIGKNLGTFKPDNTVQPSKASAIAAQLAQSGFFIANHTYSHPFLPKLSEKEMRMEIERTARLLDKVAEKHTPLFRPPYGAQNDRVLAVLAEHNLKSLLWHVDSKDWADPIPASIANRVIRQVHENKRGVILFHDIHARTVEALPLVLETLKADGYRFLSWNGKAFVDEAGPEAAPEKPTTPSELYRESWAVIIGIDNYLHWPKLQYAANDAKGIREMLIRRYRFKADKVLMLLNEEATREKILSALGDAMANPDKVKREDRVFVFFAGHGITRKLPSGRELGYIVPVEADLQNYQGQCISMTNFQDISEAIPAKHLFFVMDACYSGLALLRGASSRSENYLHEVSRRTARQMLTAGGAAEQVADNGPNGHSVFTWTLLQGLEGRADLNNDGFITASELAAYVGPTVSGLGKQTPAFGSLAGSEGGEFIFDPSEDREFLSEVSVQLDEEAIQLNDQLEHIRKQIAEKRLRNKNLQKELTAALAEAAKVDPSLKSQPGSVIFAKHMERGDAMFKEKKYSEALKEFLSAAKLDGTNPLAANNAGYMYYKMEQYEEALRWFQKTIALDPKRSVAFGNLGDTYLSLNRKEDARKAFLKYLELAPTSKNAAVIKEKVSQLQ